MPHGKSQCAYATIRGENKRMRSLSLEIVASLARGGYGLRKDAGMAAFTTIQIVGPSMEPALRNHEIWLAKPGKSAKAGQIIVFHEPGRPELLAVKRISHATSDGWLVVADNPVGAIDSQRFGPVPFDAVVARLLFRVRPLFRRS